MSADNYVVVKRFGKNDFWWGMWFASEDNPDFSDKNFNHGPFKTPLEAAENANAELEIIEYGIDYTSDCLVTE